MVEGFDVSVTTFSTYRILLLRRLFSLWFWVHDWMG